MIVEIFEMYVFNNHINACLSYFPFFSSDLLLKDSFYQGCSKDPCDYIGLTGDFPYFKVGCLANLLTSATLMSLCPLPCNLMCSQVLGIRMCVGAYSAYYID